MLRWTFEQHRGDVKLCGVRYFSISLAQLATTRSDRSCGADPLGDLDFMFTIRRRVRVR